MLQEVFHVDEGPVTLSVPATLSPEKMWWIGLGFSCAALSDGQMPKQPGVALIALAFQNKEAANWGGLTDRPTHSGNRANVDAQWWPRLFFREQNPKPFSYFRTDCGVVG